MKYNKKVNKYFCFYIKTWSDFFPATLKRGLTDSLDTLSNQIAHCASEIFVPNSACQVEPHYRPADD